MKTCYSCSEEKDNTLFRANRNQCLVCYKKYLIHYRKYNKQNLKIKRVEKHKANPEKMKLANKISYEKHKENRLLRNHQYYSENQEKLVLYQRDYRYNNSSLIADYHRNRYHNDIQYRLKILIKSTVRRFLKNKNGKSITKYLPYTVKNLKEYIESKFEFWMSWDNQGKYDPKTWDDNDYTTWKWNIDHIIPHSDFHYLSIEDENFRKCWALENLRPLSAKQNLLDGSKKTRHNEKEITLPTN